MMTVPSTSTVIDNFNYGMNAQANPSAIASAISGPITKLQLRCHHVSPTAFWRSRLRLYPMIDFL